MTALEKLAREHDALLTNYDALLRVAHDVASGRTAPERLSVDLQARTWAVAEAPAGFQPDELAAMSERYREVEERVRQGARRTAGDFLPGEGEAPRARRTGAVMIPGGDEPPTLDEIKRACAAHEAGRNGDH